ncbi:RbsD/FucU family protein [Yinghuangia sp. YIM S10712]|uniref:RbsD/FucU family protein n=1 Tax=Yinghuangia sp. YIM S10712 TaxID=3436930 RepID=UPI003F534980
MLKGIPGILTPKLLWTIAAMGHGDQLAVVDRNYPAYSRHRRVVPLAGARLAETATAITALMPIDEATASPGYFMVPDGGPDTRSPIHQQFIDAVSTAEGRPIGFEPLERTPFYEHAKPAFAVVLTGDDASYGCFLLAKGVVTPTL